MRYALLLLALALAALLIVLWLDGQHASIVRLGITPRPTPTPAPSTMLPPIVRPIGDCTPR